MLEMSNSYAEGFSDILVNVRETWSFSFEMHGAVILMRGCRSRCSNSYVSDDSLFGSSCSEREGL